MPKKQYWAHILTGGAAGALDLIDGTALNDLDMAYVVTADLFYTYTLDADSGASESSPDVISPDTNAGTKRWVLTGIGAGITTFTNTGLHIFDTNASHDLIIKPGSDLQADRTLTLTTGDADRTLTLNENFTIGDGTDITITGVTAARTLTMNENFTIGDGNDGTLTYSAASKTLTVADDCTVNQDLQTTDGPTFASVTVSDDGWIGLGAAKGRMEFDDQATDEINFLDCYVGIGTSSPTSPLHIQKTLDPISNIYAMKFEPTYTPSAPPGTIYPQAFNMDATYDSSENFSGILIGTHVRTTVAGSGGGPVRIIDVFFDNQSTATIPLMRSIHIRNPANTGGGSITTNYALYIEDQTTGNTNYAIYAAGGQSYFNGNVGIGTTTFGTNAAKTFAMALGTEPTGDVANQFALSAFDFAAGNTCPRFRTENGTVIGLNQSLLTTDSPVFNKVKITSIGGIAVQLTNKTGANTVAGQLVKSDTATDDGVILAAADDDESFGVFLDSGIAANAEAWVVSAGIADVAMQDDTAATHGNWVRSSVTEAGYADATNAAAPGHGIGNADIHFHEIGHCIETVNADGGGTHILARCILHFN